VAISAGVSLSAFVALVLLKARRSQRGIVNLSGRGMLVVSVARQRSGRGLLCSPIMLPRSSRAGPEKGALGPLS
jgi:hypothetical protein